MAITQAAKKAIRNSAKKAVFNLRRKRAVKDIEKKIDNLVSKGKLKEAKEMLPEAYKKIDKAVKGGTLKENTGSRKKARLSRITKENK